MRAAYLGDEAFTPENAKRASPAAEGMCKWVHAMSAYDKVAKVVAPKKAKLAEAEAEYARVMEGLTAKRAELQVISSGLRGEREYGKYAQGRALTGGRRAGSHR